MNEEEGKKQQQQQESRHNNGTFTLCTRREIFFFFFFPSFPALPPCCIGSRHTLATDPARAYAVRFLNKKKKKKKGRTIPRTNLLSLKPVFLSAAAWVARGIKIGQAPFSSSTHGAFHKEKMAFTRVRNASTFFCVWVCLNVFSFSFLRVLISVAGAPWQTAGRRRPAKKRNEEKKRQMSATGFITRLSRPFLSLSYRLWMVNLIYSR